MDRFWPFLDILPPCATYNKWYMQCKKVISTFQRWMQQYTKHWESCRCMWYKQRVDTSRVCDRFLHWHDWTMTSAGITTFLCHCKIKVVFHRIDAVLKGFSKGKDATLMLRTLARYQCWKSLSPGRPRGCRLGLGDLFQDAGSPTGWSKKSYLSFHKTEINL